MIATKHYIVALNLSFSYNANLVDEWEDNGDRELNYLNEAGIKTEIQDFLENLGFVVGINVIEYKDKGDGV